jgi:Lon protease-like protein
MFPLGSVLLPGEVLPLHVFEPRYRKLVVDCVESPDHSFGVTLIERGSEVGGGDQRATVGTLARLVQVAELGDGRFAVVAVGADRIRVHAWLPDDPYPLADVDVWPDAPGDDGGRVAGDEGLVSRVTQRARRSCALARELGDPVGDPSQEISGELLAASYQLVSLSPVGPSDRYALLCADGPVQRLRALESMLDDVEVLLRYRLEAGGNQAEPGEM